MSSIIWVPLVEELALANSACFEQLGASTFCMCARYMLKLVGDASVRPNYVSIVLSLSCPSRCILLVAWEKGI